MEDANKHFGNAVTVAGEHGLRATRFVHDGDQRIRLTYGGDKLARLALDLPTALSWVGAFYPEATILTIDSDRMIISVGQ